MTPGVGEVRPRGTRLRQAAVLAIGCVLAAAMVVLGVWQLEVYQAQGSAVAERRAAEQAVPLPSVARPGTAVIDGYGRSVTVSGRYQPELQVLVPLSGESAGFRVLTGLRQDDGSVVAIVRGVVSGPSAPPPPAGPVQQTGVLLPSEENVGGTAPPTGQLGSVRLPQLAQQWPGPIINGFVTLRKVDADAQGIDAAPLNLPEARGRLRNGAYALQWWLFAGFTVVLAARMARDFAVPADPPGPDPEQAGPGPVEPT